MTNIEQLVEESKKQYGKEAEDSTPQTEKQRNNLLKLCIEVLSGMREKV